MMSVRLATPDDRALIHHSWSRTMRDAQVLKHVPDALFFRGMKSEIDRLLERSSTHVLCSDEDPTQIFSYVVSERLADELIIHFAYTKSFYWKMGLITNLLDAIEPDVKTKGFVITCFPPCFTDDRWHVNDKPFWFHLREKHKVLFNPFFKEI